MKSIINELQVIRAAIGLLAAFILIIAIYAVYKNAPLAFVFYGIFGLIMLHWYNRCGNTIQGFREIDELLSAK